MELDEILVSTLGSNVVLHCIAGLGWEEVEISFLESAVSADPHLLRVGVLYKIKVAWFGLGNPLVVNSSVHTIPLSAGLVGKIQSSKGR